MSKGFFVKDYDRPEARTPQPGVPRAKEMVLWKCFPSCLKVDILLWEQLSPGKYIAKEVDTMFRWGNSSCREGGVVTASGTKSGNGPNKNASFREEAVWHGFPPSDSNKSGVSLR